MKLSSSVRPKLSRRLAPLVRPALLAVSMIAYWLGVAPTVARADGSAEQPVAHVLEVVVAFPDTGLGADESLCVALFPDDGSPLDALPPLQTACLGPGADQVRFDSLSHGAFRAVVPAAASILTVPRYQGQIVSVAVPDAADVNQFRIDLPLALEPTFAGVTGSIEVNVYGCPPGTNGGGDATVWREECDALIGGAPVSLSGIGTIDDVSSQEVTAQEGDAFGRVEFADLPAGEYRLEGLLPESVADNPAYFVGSSIDGGLPAAIDPNDSVAVRPTEVLAVDVFVPLEPAPAPPTDSSGSANPSIGDAAPADEGRDEPPPAGLVQEPLLAGIDNADVVGGLPETSPAATPISAENETP